MYILIKKNNNKNKAESSFAPSLKEMDVKTTYLRYNKGIVGSGVQM